MFHHPKSSKQDYMSEVHPCSNTSYRPQMETTESNVWSVLYTDPCGPWRIFIYAIKELGEQTVISTHALSSGETGMNFPYLKQLFKQGSLNSSIHRNILTC